MVLNSNIPHFKAFVKRSYFTQDESDTEFDSVYVFAIQSVAGKILTFHVMTDYGMLRSRVPISEIYTDIPTGDIPFHFKQLWDCFSENVSVIEYDFLAEHRCQVVLKDGTLIWASYLFTVDWYNNPYSDEPSDYKAGHILESDDGYLLCMPNNRLYWKDSNWITKKFPIDPKKIKVDQELLTCENQSDRWISEDSNNYYYDMKQEATNQEAVKTVNEKNTVPITDVNETPDTIIAHLQDYCHKHGYYIAKIEIVAL